MQQDFWLERWQEGQIGFHQDRINGYLTRYFARTGAQQGGTVLVTLCGKSLDMLWLREQGFHVVGVEISPLAVEAFFDENKLQPEITSSGKFQRYHADDITLLCGDFFDLTAADIGDVAAVYDRASLIALPPEMRTNYADHLTRLVPRGTRVLLVTMEYPQEEMQGPPFSVRESEVHGLYDNNFEVECLESIDVLAENPRFKERGLSEMIERTFLLTRK
ncbi:MAG: thiopurine S-methyltransferase [Gammaproteobacteria bacterium]|jgi:thiopurine S-methyltransferase